MHGFEPGAHTCPKVALPFATPFTVQVTAEFEVPETVATKFALWPVIMAAEGGETVTAIGELATIETLAVAFCVAAAALIVIELGDGTAAGAV